MKTLRTFDPVFDMYSYFHNYAARCVYIQSAYKKLFGLIEFKDWPDSAQGQTKSCIDSTRTEHCHEKMAHLHFHQGVFDAVSNSLSYSSRQWRKVL